MRMNTTSYFASSSRRARRPMALLVAGVAGSWAAHAVAQPAPTCEGEACEPAGVNAAAGAQPAPDAAGALGDSSEAVVALEAEALAAEGPEAEALVDRSNDVDALGELTGRRWTLKGKVTSQTTGYLVDRDAPGEGQGWIGEVRLELNAQLSPELSARVRPWLLLDAFDPDVLRYEPLEAHLDYTAERWDVRVGQFIESWGIVDTVNPLDILNRTDLAVDALSPPRRGEAGVRVRAHGEGGDVVGQPSVGLYLMPLFRETDFPSEGSRMRPRPPGGVLVPAKGVRPDGAEALLAAIRAEHTLSTPWLNADVQYILARGPSHAPALGVLPQPDGSLQFAPDYFGTYTVGGGFRAVPNGRLSALTFKAEVAYVRPYQFAAQSGGLPEDFLRLAAGVSRSFVLDSAAELNVNLEVLGELLADDALAKTRLFGNDVAVRLAWAANDPALTALEVRAIVDWQDGTVLGNLVARRQLLALHQDLQLELDAQFAHVGDDTATALPSNPTALIGRLVFAF